MTAFRGCVLQRVGPPEGVLQRVRPAASGSSRGCPSEGASCSEWVLQRVSFRGRRPAGRPRRPGPARPPGVRRQDRRAGDLLRPAVDRGEGSRRVQVVGHPLRASTARRASTASAAASAPGWDAGACRAAMAAGPRRPASGPAAARPPPARPPSSPSRGGSGGPGWPAGSPSGRCPWPAAGTRTPGCPATWTSSRRPGGPCPRARSGGRTRAPRSPRASGRAEATRACEALISWCGKIRSVPPACTSNARPRYSVAIAAHSTCQPGRPGPNGRPRPAPPAGRPARPAASSGSFFPGPAGIAAALGEQLRHRRRVEPRHRAERRDRTPGRSSGHPPGRRATRARPAAGEALDDASASTAPTRRVGGSTRSASMSPR